VARPTAGPSNILLPWAFLRAFEWPRSSNALTLERFFSVNAASSMPPNLWLEMIAPFYERRAAPWRDGARLIMCKPFGLLNSLEFLCLNFQWI
jgi:hypothetical protein